MSWRALFFVLAVGIPACRNSGSRRTSQTDVPGASANETMGLQMKVLSTEEVRGKYPAAAGTVQSAILPTRIDGSPRMVVFYYGFKYISATEGATTDSPGDIHLLDAENGAMLSQHKYEGPHRVFGAPPYQPVDYARWMKLQDVLAMPFYRGEVVLPDTLGEEAKEYRALFLNIAGAQYLPYYIEIAPDWCAWIGIHSKDLELR